MFPPLCAPASENWICFTPEPPGLSVASSVTEMFALFQPLPFGPGDGLAVVAGGIVSEPATTNDCVVLFVTDGSAVLVAVTVIDTPVPAAVPGGTVTSTFTVAEAPPSRVMRDGSTLPTKRQLLATPQLSVAVMRKVEGAPTLRTTNKSLVVVPAANVSTGLGAATMTT